MKKYHFIPLLSSILVFNSCTSTAPINTSTTHTQHLQDHTPNTVIQSKPAPPTTAVTEALPSPFQPTQSRFIPTHGIPGKPC